jgi:hypothetical protein
MNSIISLCTLVLMYLDQQKLRSHVLVAAKVKVKLILCLIIIRNDSVWKSGVIAPRILKLGATWNRVVTYTSQLLTPKNKLARKLYGTTSN